MGPAVGPPDGLADGLADGLDDGAPLGSAVVGERVGAGVWLTSKSAESPTSGAFSQTTSSV